MNQKYIIILLWAVAILLTACKPKEGKDVIESYENKTPRIEKSWIEKGGVKEYTKETHYYASGQKEKEGGLKDGLREGNWKAWYQNGTIWSEGDFIQGKSHGVFKIYAENGVLQLEKNYNNGILDGTTSFFDGNGNLTKEVEYKDGVVISQNNKGVNAPLK